MNRKFTGHAGKNILSNLDNQGSRYMRLVGSTLFCNLIVNNRTLAACKS